MENNNIIDFENDILNQNNPQKVWISAMQNPLQTSTLPPTRVQETKWVRIGNGPTLEEKIDYIYTHLKAQKRNARIKLSLKIFVIIAIYYFVVMIYPTIPQEKIEGIKSDVSKMISSQVSAIAKPMIEDITNDMVKNMWETNGDTVGGTTINQSKIDEFLKKHPELKDKIKQ